MVRIEFGQVTPPMPACTMISALLTGTIESTPNRERRHYPLNYAYRSGWEVIAVGQDVEACFLFQTDEDPAAAAKTPMLIVQRSHHELHRTRR